MPRADANTLLLSFDRCSATRCLPPTSCLTRATSRCRTTTRPTPPTRPRPRDPSTHIPSTRDMMRRLMPTRCRGEVACRSARDQARHSFQHPAIIRIAIAVLAAPIASHRTASSSAAALIWLARLRHCQKSARRRDRTQAPPSWLLSSLVAIASTSCAFCNFTNVMISCSPRARELKFMPTRGRSRRLARMRAVAHAAAITVDVHGKRSGSAPAGDRDRPCILGANSRA